MRMFIPEIGTKIILTRPWDILIHEERRNASVHERLKAALPEAEVARMEAERLRVNQEMRQEGVHRWTEGYAERMPRLWEQWERAMIIPVTLPAGTELTVDRIYIRKGVSSYSSLTFHLTKTTHPVLAAKGRRRFWVKLDQVNRMEFDLLEPQAAAA